MVLAKLLKRLKLESLLRSFNQSETSPNNAKSDGLCERAKHQRVLKKAGLLLNNHAVASKLPLVSVSRQLRSKSEVERNSEAPKVKLVNLSRRADESFLELKLVSWKTEKKHVLSSDHTYPPTEPLLLKQKPASQWFAKLKPREVSSSELRNVASNLLA